MKNAISSVVATAVVFFLVTGMTVTAAACPWVENQSWWLRWFR
jgi:hypothetical protein